MWRRCCSLTTERRNGFGWVGCNGRAVALSISLGRELALATQGTPLGTLGLPLFGHLDLEVIDSTHSEEDVFAMLANISDYIISSDSFLLPGQTIGYREGEDLQISQAVSDADGQPVIRIQF